ncbi:MAG: Ppx/GppA family phosphatase [Bacteroidota bacterium]
MKIASIDIGTNTTLLLIAEIDKQGIVRPLHEEQRMPRMGKGVDANRLIERSAFDRVASVIHEYNSIIENYHVDTVVAGGTSALRDALNKKEFVISLKEKTGIQVEVLSGTDEALWSFQGALNGIGVAHHSAAVLDIGGGSTEISVGVLPLGAREDVQVQRNSFQLGSVRVTERFFKALPPTETHLHDAREYIASQLISFRDWNISNRSLIGVAGTVTTLACLEQRLPEFDRVKVSGYKLSMEAIRSWQDNLSKLTPSQIRKLSNVTEGRQDLLTAGVLILHEFMKYFKFQEITVSERGLRYGLVMREWKKTVKIGK